MSDQEAFDLFRKAGSDFAEKCHQLQVTPDELLTIFLLIIARDAGVALPDTFSQLTTNYAAFLAGADFNDEKKAIANYLSFMKTDLETLRYTLCTLIAQKRAIAGIQSSFNSLPAAPYIAPPQKHP